MSNTTASKFHQAIAAALGCPVTSLTEVTLDLNALEAQDEPLSPEQEIKSLMFDKLRKLDQETYPTTDPQFFYDDANEFDGSFNGPIEVQGVKMVFTYEGEDNGIQRIWSVAPPIPVTHVLTLDYIAQNTELRQKFLAASSLDIVNSSIIEQFDGKYLMKTVVKFDLVHEGNLETYRISFPVILYRDVRFEAGKDEILLRIRTHCELNVFEAPEVKKNPTVFMVIDQDTMKGMFAGYAFERAYEAWFQMAMKFHVTLEDSNEMTICDSRTEPWTDKSVELGLMTQEANDSFHDSL